MVTNMVNISILTILGDSWNYMSPILFPSFDKRIATQILAIGKLNERQDLDLRALPVITRHLQDI